MNEILTAQTERGRAALAQVMAHSMESDVKGLPPQWVRVLVADSLPVSYVAIDPACAIAYPRGEVAYACIRAGATREDGRGRGYFRMLLEDAIGALRQAGALWVIGRLPFGLGRELGFAAFTNYSAFILRPEEIEQTLGGSRPDTENGSALTLVESSDFQEDLLLVADVRADSEFECVQALREAAWAARSRGKMRILFEHPPASAPGSPYAIHGRRQTPLTKLAMACHARIRIQGADAEDDEGDVDQSVYTDMVRLIDLPQTLARVLDAVGAPDAGLRGCVGFDTDAGRASITGSETGWSVSEKIAPGASVVPFSFEIVAQILTGYRSAKTQSYLSQSESAQEPVGILDRLFPRFWRFSRNDKWVSRQWTEPSTLQVWE